MRKFSIALIIAIAAAPLLFSQGLQYEPPKIEGYEPPFRSSYRSPFTDSSPAILKNNGKFFSDTMAIDFEKRQLTFSRQDSAGNKVWTYHYDELSDYISDKKSHSFYESWYQKLSEESKQAVGPPPAPKLQWELSVHYPPWAQRLLGNDPPRLKIEGRLELTVAYDYRQTQIGKDGEKNYDVIPLDFDHNYDFSITGSVGRLISVNIKHTKQDGFDLGDDPLKNFKVEYRESEPGELEDEIIQEIVAGYMGFEMPGTNLSGYSEKHDGLFGIKVRAKLGPLMLTTVASHAQGEALTVELGGKNDPNSTAALRENEFIPNRYFFLDNVYREYYNKANNMSMPDGNAREPPVIRDFQAFVSIQCDETKQNTALRYMVDFNNDGNEVCFRMLEENKDYRVDRARGWVRFEHNIRDQDIVAITMATQDGSLKKGDRVPISAADKSRQNLWMLKPQNMEELGNTHPLFGLMWRNVYYLGEIEDAAPLDIFYLNPAIGDTIRHSDAPRAELLSKVLGVTDDQGRARTGNVQIFNRSAQELVLPPWGPELNGNEPFANPALGSYADSLIYRLGPRTTFMAREYVPKFGMKTGGATRKASYDNLGWNILEGTVTVKTNTGTLLVEDEDYEIDYQMGVIDLLSTRAKAAESIIVTYQRESDFVLDKKVFAGVRGELRLPFISDNSFMAASLLYQNAATSADDIPQLGNEPFSKLHLSFNTSLDFEPEWMTKAVNYLPLVKSETNSAAKLDFEVVHSRMNTNTSGDRAAYLDDFERSKDSYSVSVRHTSWHPSHYPFPYTGGLAGIEAEMLTKRKIPVWDFYWFTPSAYDDTYRISRYEVWERDPNNSRQSSSDNYIDVLRMHATPAPAFPAPVLLQDRFRDSSYASVTTSFGRNGLNMENHRYLELVVNPKGVSGPLSASAKKGKLMVQIGTFSHDQVRDGGPPNGRLDIEDTTFQNRPELMKDFDKGLNRRDVEDKFYVIPKADGTGWDTLSRTQNTEWLVFPRSYDNPSGDMFRRYDRDNLGNYRYANGTWGNSIYDTENIDHDGIPRINFEEKYYTYEIDLDDANSPYIDRTARVQNDRGKGWRFYRIPIKDILDDISASVRKDSAAAGGHDWSKVRGMRLVWHGFDRDAPTHENELLIAGLELVGNYWEPAAGAEKNIEPTSISNYEDIDYYNSVFGTIVKPKSGEATPEERSLRLRFFNIASGDTALVRRNMSFYPQNISGYDSVSVMVNPREYYGEDLKFVFRFGSDDSTYYEYSSPMPKARAWNRFAFSLQDLSDLKILADRDTGQIDVSSMNLRVVARAPNKRPNFTAVTYMAIGVAGGGAIIDEGEIWVNELMAVGARALTGIAARLNLSTQWADFMSLGFGAGYTDGDFRTMTDAPAGSESRSEIFANVNAKMHVNKFLPEEWGVLIPVGGSVSGSLSRPTVKPQSDILLLNDDGNPDGFMDMAGDGLDRMFGRKPEGGKTRAQDFETFSTTRNAYTSFEKTSESENPFIGFTLDRIKTDVSYNLTASYTGRGPHEDPDSADFFAKTDTVLTYAGNLRYDLSPRNPPPWTSAAPFGDAKWMPALYRKYRFNLLPSAINFDLAEMQHRTEKRNDARLNVHDFTTRAFDMRHGVQVEYTPIDPLLSLSYGTKVDRDLSALAENSGWDAMMDSTFPGIFGLNRSEGEVWDEYWLLFGERGRTQAASAKLTPQFVTWMTHSAEYSANYTGQMTRRDNDSAQYLNAGVGTALRFKNSLLLTDMFKKLGKAGAAAGKDTVGGKAQVDRDSTAGKTAQPGKGFLEKLGDGVTKINMRTINFEYDVKTDLKNSFLSSTYLSDTAGMGNYDFFKYQLGMNRDLGDYIFGRQGGGGLGYMGYRLGSMSEGQRDLYRFDQSMGSWTARLSTSFTIPDPIKINVSSVSFGWGREFHGQPDSLYIDTTIVLPEIRVSAGTEVLTKFSFFRKHLSRLGLTSSASYKQGRKESRERSDTTTALEFAPLMSFDGKFIKWPSLSANYRMNWSNAFTVNGGKDTGDSAKVAQVGRLSTENVIKSGHTLTLAYEFTAAGKLQEVKLAKWVIPVQGKTNVGLSVNREHTETITNKRGAEGDEEERRIEWEFNYSPFIDYRFTSNVRGQARYLGSHKNQDGRYLTQQRFELMAEITF